MLFCVQFSVYNILFIFAIRLILHYSLTAISTEKTVELIDCECIKIDLLSVLVCLVLRVQQIQLFYNILKW